MGRFMNWVNKIGHQAYRGSKQIIGKGYNGIHKVVSTIGNISDKVDNILKSAEQQGGVVGDIASLIENNDLYKEVRTGIKLGRDVVEGAGKLGKGIEGLLDPVFESGASGFVRGGTPIISPVKPPVSIGRGQSLFRAERQAF